MFGKKEEEKKEFISLSELEDRLIADKDGKVKKEILGKLKEYEHKLSGKIDGGTLAPNEFEAASAIRESIRHAHEIVTDYHYKES